MKSAANAVQISPPFWCPATSHYRMRIEYLREAYILSWTHANNHHPDISRFPALAREVSVEKVVHSGEEQAIWDMSRLIGFGAHAHVREDSSGDDAEFPVVKVAHEGERAQRQIENEFGILSGLAMGTAASLTVCVAEAPLADGRGIFGVRMQRPVRIPYEDLAGYCGGIAEALRVIHGNGLVHGDVHPDNVMLDQMGRIRLIDFGCAGFIGDVLPVDHNSRRFLGWETFQVQIDIDALEKMRRGKD